MGSGSDEPGHCTNPGKVLCDPGLDVIGREDGKSAHCRGDCPAQRRNPAKQLKQRLNDPGCARLTTAPPAGSAGFGRFVGVAALEERAARSVFVEALDIIAGWLLRIRVPPPGGFLKAVDRL